jgi:hypothetical protein
MTRSYVDVRTVDIGGWSGVSMREYNAKGLQENTSTYVI